MNTRTYLAVSGKPTIDVLDAAEKLAAILDCRSDAPADIAEDRLDEAIIAYMEARRRAR